MMSVADCVNIESKGLLGYVSRAQEGLLMMAKKHAIGKDTDALSYKRERKEERQRDCEGKPLHGKFRRETGKESGSKTWGWLKKGNLAKVKATLPIASSTIIKRQKLMGLADSSTYGWATVSLKNE